MASAPDLFARLKTASGNPIHLVHAMKIAQIAPLMESCPPRFYGGTERIVTYLTDELVRLGHRVTLFASGDSQTTGRLVPCCPAGLRFDPAVGDPLPYYVTMLEELRNRAYEFDLVHFHIDYLHALMGRELPLPTLTTLHGRLDWRGVDYFYSVFPRMPVVTISDSQGRDLRSGNVMRTIHHGLPRDLLPFNPAPKRSYLAFLGRIAREKRPDLAIEIANRTGIPLKIAAKIDRSDLGYWREVIKPMVDSSPTVEYIGEIDERQKASFLGNALALLFPIQWPEPFGLVLIEAMSCGTPTVAFRCGSVPEIVEDGISGIIVDNVDDAVEAVSRVSLLDRRQVRGCFERRFTAERLARDYSAVYSGLLAQHETMRASATAKDRKPRITQLTKLATVPVAETAAPATRARPLRK